MLFAGIHFPPACCKTEKVILQRRGKMNGRTAQSLCGVLICALCYIEKTTVNGKITYLQIYDVMFLGTGETNR